METGTATQKENGLAITSMILGIVGLVFFWVPFIPYPLAILAVIFGFVGMKKVVGKGFSVAGIVTGLITLGLKLMFWIGVASLGTAGW